MTRSLLLTLALGTVALTPACAEKSAAADSEVMTRAQVETIVRDYIMENPQIIEEALIELGERQRRDEAEAARKAIVDNRDALYNQASDPAIGPDDAEITVVEFFDYRCGYCKRSLDFVSGLPARHDGKVRVVFKEYPILSPQSRQAALAALAAKKQGKYFEMHAALMETDTKLDDGDIDEIAREAGVDVDKLRADMKSTAIQQELADSMALARDLGVNGTPAFFIGDEAIQGANTPKITQVIEDTLEG